MVDAQFDNIYMLFSLGAWMFVCYFLYKHESVIEELGDMDEDEVTVCSEEISLSGLEKEINKLFVEEKLYLNPQLKLSDVARKWVRIALI